MRYKVKYDSEASNWVVVDSAIAEQIVGIHRTHRAALRHAEVEEARWQQYDSSFMGTPPLAVA